MKKHEFQAEIEEIVRRTCDELRVLSGCHILMSGGNGFLGRYFTGVFRLLNQELLDKPCRVTICDNNIANSQPEESGCNDPHIKMLSHDVIRPIDVQEPLDYIIHAAGIASPFYYRKYPLETLEVATVGTRNFLNLALQHRVKGFLYFSSSEIYGDPDPAHVPTPESYRGNVSCMGPRACYDESKRVGETLCSVFHTLHGLPTKSVRPFNVYGPGMRENDYRVLPNFASCIIGHRPLHIYGHGKQTRTFCYITDAMTGFLKTLLKGVSGEVYNIGTPEPEVSMVELLRLLEEVEGCKLSSRLIEYPDAYPADEPQRRCPDIRKAAIQLGYHPEVALKDGLARFMQWAKAHYKGVQT